MEKISKFNKRRAFNKAVGPGKNPKLIAVGPTFIPDYRVTTEKTEEITVSPKFLDTCNKLFLSQSEGWRNDAHHIGFVSPMKFPCSRP